MFGFYCLRTIDRKYSDLINRTVPTLNELQELTAASMTAMRSTNPNSFGNSSPAEIVQHEQTALAHDRELRTQILQREWLSDNPRERLVLEETGNSFDQKADEILGLFGAGQNAEATQAREQTLRPAWDRYVAATSRAADLFQKQSIKTSNVFTERTLSVSKIMLGLASWPVIALTLFFTVTAALAVVVLLLFDRKVA